MRNLGRAVRADQRLDRARQPLGELKRVEESGKEERSNARPPPPTSPGSATPSTSNLPGDPLGDTCVYARDFAKLKAEGKAPPTTYAHIARQVGHPGLRRPVLVLLVLQPVQRPARGRLGGDADRLRSEHRAPGAARRPERNDPLPARRRRAGRLGRLEGGEGRDAPGRLPRRRLARDLLRLDRLRPERQQRLRRRLRQHQRTAARSAGPPGRDPDLPDHARAASSGSPTSATGARRRRASTTGRPAR